MASLRVRLVDRNGSEATTRLTLSLRCVNASTSMVVARGAGDHRRGG